MTVLEQVGTASVATKRRESPADIFMRYFMMFWYPYVGWLNRLMPSIKVAGKTFMISPGVYKPLENEHGCLDYVPQGARVLDVGCGSGVCGIFAAAKAREVLGVDISAAAVANATENCKRLGVKNMKVKQSDMFAAVTGKFDVVLANPPYLGIEFESETEQFATSVRFLPALFGQAARHLTPDGRLLVQFPLWYRRRLERLAAANGLELVSVKRTALKGPGLFLLSLAYMQVGWRSAFYVFRVKR